MNASPSSQPDGELGDAGRPTVQGLLNGSPPPERQVDWDEVHRAVQSILSPMMQNIREKSSRLRARAGRTQGRDFNLFSYVEFDVPEDETVDGIGAGVLFETTKTGDISVLGDIVENETGSILFECQRRTVVNDRTKVTAAAEEAARQLVEHQDEIVRMLTACDSGRHRDVSTQARRDEL